MATVAVVFHVMGAVGWTMVAFHHSVSRPLPVWFVRFAFALLAFDAVLRAIG